MELLMLLNPTAFVIMVTYNEVVVLPLEGMSMSGIIDFLFINPNT